MMPNHRQQNASVHAFALALAVGVAGPTALAQDTQAATDVADMITELSDQLETPVEGQIGEGQISEGGAQPARAVYPAAARLAKWLRSIGGRISIGPKVDSKTQVSKPDPRDRRQGWRVSVPTFADARISAPPKRASVSARRNQADEEANQTGTEQAAVDTDK